MLRAKARKLIGKLFYVDLKEFIKTIQVPNTDFFVFFKKSC